jgi:SAM-dependent methyltransferase
MTAARASDPRPAGSSAPPARTPRSVLTGIERRIMRRLYGGGPERGQWLRQTMYEHVDRFFHELPAEKHRALEISGRFYGNHPWKHYESWHYPDFDLCESGPASETFDVVICDQVLEHVVDPCAATRTLFDLCAPGGHAIVAVPFLVRIHAAPGDYWRFTPDGLRLLLERAGFEVPEVEGWGNRRCVRANFLVWARTPKFGAALNEPAFPVNVWTIARKPAGDDGE